MQVRLKLSFFKPDAKASIDAEIHTKVASIHHNRSCVDFYRFPTMSRKPYVLISSNSLLSSKNALLFSFAVASDAETDLEINVTLC